MVIVSSINLKAEYWDVNLDVWTQDWLGNIWIVPGTEDQYEANWDWEKVV